MLQEMPSVCCRKCPSFAAGNTLLLLHEIPFVCCRKYPSFAAGNTFVCCRKYPWIYMLFSGRASNVKSLADALKYKPPVPKLKDARGGSGRSAGNTSSAEKLQVFLPLRCSSSHIVLAWQASYHRLAVQENGNGSQVLKRHLNKEKKL